MHYYATANNKTVRHEVFPGEMTQGMKFKEAEG